MKKLLLLLLCVPLIGLGQEIGCVSGDCENGYGKYIEVVYPSEYHRGESVDSSIYIGDWKDGKRHGEGTFIYSYFSPGKYKWFHLKYEGDWRDDKRHGNGSSYDEPGDCYIGEWDNDKWEGKGTWSHWAGGTYEGEWKNGKEHGQGTYWDAMAKPPIGLDSLFIYYDDNKLIYKRSGEYIHGKLINGTETYLVVCDPHWEECDDQKYLQKYIFTFPQYCHTKSVFLTGQKYVRQVKDGKYFGEWILSEE